MDMTNKEDHLQLELHQSHRKEEEYWRLKSQSIWLKGGDRNTSFFHKQTQARLSRNYVAEMKLDMREVLIEDDSI